MDRRVPLCLVLSLCLGACAAPPEREPDEVAGHEPMLADSGIAHAVVAEAFISTSVPADNLDSPAAWQAPDGRTWVIGSAKEGNHALVVFDGDTGATLQRIGAIGDADGAFRRPNGVFVLGDRLYVVERDNHRVQVLALPSFAPLGTFGAADLIKPYGLWARTLDDGAVEVLVTDAYMGGVDARGEEAIPALADLGRRMHRFRVRFDGDRLAAEHLGAFGDTGADGAIRTPESIWATRRTAACWCRRKTRRPAPRCATTRSPAPTRTARSAATASRRRPKASRCGRAPTAAATGC
jgi:3-phytase